MQLITSCKTESFAKKISPGELDVSQISGVHCVTHFEGGFYKTTQQATRSMNQLRKVHRYRCFKI